jgi:retinol dehydrogenase 12
LNDLMHRKTVVITGATSGIGRIAAQELAGMGARLVMIARDEARGAATLAALSASGGDHRMHYADLSRLTETKKVGAAIAAVEPSIDVLINNAGSIFASRRLTEDGLERTFATNHMAYFVLTHCLLQCLKASAPARVINTASAAHKGQNLDFGDLQMAHGYTAQRAYGRSKLANILFTRELARRLAGSGVTANCLHPGFVATGLGQRDNRLFGALVWLSMRFAGSPERGAATLVHLASSPALDGISGAYFYDRRPIELSREAQDDDAAGRLWAESARIAGISQY